MQNPNELLAALQAARRVGKVYAHIEPHVGIAQRDQLELLDSFVVRCEFQPIGEDWLEVDANEVCKGLATIIGRDLAYNAATMEWAYACELANRFMKQFSHTAHYFTNAEPWQTNSTGGRSKGSSPLTDATFDEAFLAVDENHIGILLVMDED
jgi:hypothetical protein